MKKKILITTGILISTIALSCISVSASSITQDIYYSDNVYFPDGQYALNYDINMGIASSTSNDYNKVIYNDVIEREIAEVKLQGTYFEDVYKFVNFQESTDQFENIDLITYYSNFYASIGTQRKFIEYDIWFADSIKINNDLYFNITDFFYKPNDYQGHSILWTNANNYYQAWLDEDFDINDDVGFIDYTIFEVIDDVVVPYHYRDSLVSTNAFAYYNNGTINIDAFLIETIMKRHNCYAFYINNCVLKFKDLLYYEEAISITADYYYYDEDMFTRLSGLDFDINDDINISDFFINSVGGFMDFEIVPGFTFGLLLSFILTLSLIVWIIKVFMGG